MAVGVGAHHHWFIEGVHPKLSTCSGGTSSKNLLGRCRKYDVDESGCKGEPKEGEGGDAHQIGHAEVVLTMPATAVVGGAKWGVPSLGYGGWPETAAF